MHDISKQKLSTVESFNVIHFWIAMTILVHNWAGNSPVSVTLLRHIEKKNSIGCMNLKNWGKKSRFRFFSANSVGK